MDCEKKFGSGVRVKFKVSILFMTFTLKLLRPISLMRNILSQAIDSLFACPEVSLLVNKNWLEKNYYVKINWYASELTLSVTWHFKLQHESNNGKFTENKWPFVRTYSYLDNCLVSLDLNQKHFYLLLPDGQYLNNSYHSQWNLSKHWSNAPRIIIFGIFPTLSGLSTNNLLTRKRKRKFINLINIKTLT